MKPATHITLRFSEQERREAKEKADKRGMDLTKYIKHLIRTDETNQTKAEDRKADPQNH